MSRGTLWDLHCLWCYSPTESWCLCRSQLAGLNSAWNTEASQVRWASPGLRWLANILYPQHPPGSFCPVAWETSLSLGGRSLCGGNNAEWSYGTLANGLLPSITAVNARVSCQALPSLKPPSFQGNIWQRKTDSRKVIILCDGVLERSIVWHLWLLWRQCLHKQT